MILLQITLNRHGGLVHYTSQISNALAKHNDVYVLAPIGIETEVFDKSIHLIQLPTGNIIKNFIINSIIITRAFDFYNTIKKINPDIIHLQSSEPWICLFLPFLQKFRIVTTIHDIKPHLGSRAIDQKISRNLHIKYSDALIVHGDAAKNILKKDGSNKKIFVIPHGDYSFFTKFEKEIHSDMKTILFFGSIREYKGLEYLIKAEPIIRSFIPDVNIVIAGEGNFSKYTELIKNNTNFEIHNRYIKNEEVSQFFQRASVVVLPYIEGTQTGIIPISYAFKKPVIVTDVGSIPEVVEDGVTGFIVPPRDSDALADAVIKILKDDNLRKQMGENAYRKMKEELSWDIIAKKTIKVYNNLIGDYK